MSDQDDHGGTCPKATERRPFQTASLMPPDLWMPDEGGSDLPIGATLHIFANTDYEAQGTPASHTWVTKGVAPLHRQPLATFFAELFQLVLSLFIADDRHASEILDCAFPDWRVQQPALVPLVERVPRA